MSICRSIGQTCKRLWRRNVKVTEVPRGYWVSVIVTPARQGHGAVPMRVAAWIRNAICEVVELPNSIVDLRVTAPYTLRAINFIDVFPRHPAWIKIKVKVF